MRIQVPIQNRITLQWTHTLWLFLFVISFSLQSAGLVSTFRFDRHLIDQGHYWLLLSGHLVHLNWSHWGLNMAGLLIVAVFFSAYGRVLEWLFVLVFTGIVTGVGLYWFNPELIWYVGLSGVLHGLFIYGAVREVRYYPFSGYVLLLLLVGKLFWEYMNGPLPGSEEMTGGHVVVAAHLYGAIGGFVAVLLTRATHLLYKLVQVKDRQQDS
jgi:rhomboid family GlyGly-CTERM serine protease